MNSSYWHQPDIDPVLIHLWGPLEIRWYSLLYVGAFILGRNILKKLAKEERYLFTPDDMEQFILWGLISAVVGSRVVYCLVYDLPSLLANPFYLFQTYKGGLSFHGGLIGTIIAAVIYSRKKKIPFWNLTDAMALATPTGLAMGRMGNFINGELYGRITDVPWAVIFKEGGPEPRHPSQLYEFLLEGVVLFLVMWLLRNKLKKDGQISILFLIGYSLSRFIVEFFRQPDPQLGFLIFGMSMGQILSFLMFVGGIALGIYVFKYKPLKVVSHKTRKKR